MEGGGQVGSSGDEVGGTVRNGDINHGIMVIHLL